MYCLLIKQYIKHLKVKKMASHSGNVARTTSCLANKLSWQLETKLAQKTETILKPQNAEEKTPSYLQLAESEVFQQWQLWSSAGHLWPGDQNIQNCAERLLSEI